MATIRLLQPLVTTTASYKRGDVVTGWDDTDAVRLFTAGIAEKVLTTGITSVYPAEVDATDDGQSCDMLYTGTTVKCRQIIGGVGGSGTPTLAGKIQESVDGTTWTDVTGGGFTAVTASNKDETITITRTKRYLRHVRTISGTSPTFVLCATFEPVSSTV